MVIKDLDKFNQLAESCGNRYLAVKWIAKQARDLGAANSEYWISESKLIDWALNGVCPYTEHELAIHRVPNDSDKVEEFLSWVMDDEVAQEVKRLYKQSVRNRNLTLCDNAKLSISRRQRVNILLRMLWYSTTYTGKENM